MVFQKHSWARNMLQNHQPVRIKTLSSCFTVGCQLENARWCHCLQNKIKEHHDMWSQTIQKNDIVNHLWEEVQKHDDANHSRSYTKSCQAPWHKVYNHKYIIKCEFPLKKHIKASHTFQWNSCCFQVFWKQPPRGADDVFRIFGGHQAHGLDIPKSKATHESFWSQEASSEGNKQSQILANGK